VTSDEWLSCRDPLDMVNAATDRLSDRRLRLLLVACCRRLPGLLKDPRLPDALDAAERFTDGACGEEELRRAGAAGFESHTKGAVAVALACSKPDYLRSLPWAGSFGGRYRRGSFAVLRGIDAAAEAAPGDGETRALALAAEKAEQCRLVREVVGDLGPPPRIEPTWLAWGGGLIPRLAEAAYRERQLPSGHLDKDRLAVLADALEEAGCPQDHELLLHLRRPGTHVRGCFALDLLLIKA
jgi:hypothetical protein